MYPGQAAARPPHYTFSHPHHAVSQKRPPRAETGKTSAAQSMSKAVRGLPIVERRGSIVPGFPRAPCPFAIINLVFQQACSSLQNRH